MQSAKHDHTHPCCKAAGPNLKKNNKSRWLMLLFPLTGLACLIWFLFRVIPKPSRAAYPCQRVAFPLASGFVAWVAALAASVVAFKKARLSLTKRRYAVALLCIAVSVTAVWLALGINAEKLALADPEPANQPVGIARGINPGRVVWVHDPKAATWEGPGRGHPWDGTCTDQQRVNEMVSRALRELTGAANDKQAWDKLFKYHNGRHARGNVGYKPGEKIAVKVNFVGLLWRHGTVNPATYELEKWRDYMNTSPQVIMALFRQLVENAGVRQSDITLVDSIAYLANEYYDIMHKEFPDVKYVDYGGKSGRIKTEPSSVPMHWSCKPKTRNQDYIPRCFAEADYLINLANLKAHTATGVTLTAKNHYGSLGRWPVQEGFYDLHESVFSGGPGNYRALVDLIGHAHLGGKTMLYLLDGLYCGRHPIDTVPLKWKSHPFNGHWTSSFLASQDPVAIDSVGVDFLQAEYEDYPHKSQTTDYLREAALADNPPSGTFYDPDHSGDVKQLASLGVFEHWNNATDKKYSRNLGTGSGIELVAVTTAETTKQPIVAPGAELVRLADGFKFTEGPAVDAEGNVFFTDQPNNKILKWSVDGQLSVFHDSPGRANGLYFDKKGNLIACADLNNELWSIDPRGKATILVKDYKGKKLNGPNDAWIAPNGGIYFTDPFYKRPYWNRGPMEQDGQHVYYLAPYRKKLTRVIDDLVQPNGIIGTPDGGTLYVADIGDRKTYVYKVGADGALSNRKLFCSMGSDGMTIDNEGNIYLTGRGVTVFDSDGRQIEHIDVPQGWTANVCFGGKDRHTLFITAQTGLYALQMRVKGVY
jgi:gluconolactonase